MRGRIARLPAVVLAAAALMLGAGASEALGSPLLVVKGDQVTREQDPALPSARATRLVPPRGHGNGLGRSHRPLSNSEAGVARARSVRGAIKHAARSKSITAAEKRTYLRAYGRALRTYRRLGGLRRSNLGDVIFQTQRMARNGTLTGSRMAAVFMILDRNRQWWGRKGTPAAGARLRFSPSRLILQYYPGHGLQFQPLANFGYASGQWKLKSPKHRANLKRLLDELVAIRSVRAGFTTWEYYFPFGGGVPPWTSGMSQGTALQALSRGSVALKDKSYLHIAAKALPAFRRNTPVGVRVPSGSGAWYALYSFAPGQKVLNGFIQSLIGLWDYRDISGDRSATAPFEQGERVARKAVPSFDTGAWSIYQLGGAESDLNYHTLVTQFMHSICKRTKRTVFCRTGDRFTRYLKTPPRFGSVHAGAHSVRFRLSKISTVTLMVKRGRRVVSFRRVLLPYRGHFLPFSRPSGGGTFKLTAKDLAGNRSAPVRGKIH